MTTTLDSSLRHGAATDLDLARMVEPERVHRRVYVDPDVYELEMDRIFGRAWIYVGHESQVPNAGDYFTTQVGRQPVVMTRHSDGQIHVLENRCPHKGTLVCPQQTGHAKRLVCMYHGWSFDTDGSLAAVPVRSGYDGTAFDPSDKNNGMKRLPRVENYRGFVFASLAADGPDLKTWAGDGMRSFDSIVDRAPDGQIEIIGSGYRTVQNSNWKIFIDNMSDGMHTSFVHNQSARAAKRTLEKFKIEHAGGLQLTAMLAGEPDQMAKIDLVAHPNGHFDMAAFAPEPKGPDAQKYKAAMIARHGEAGTEAILKRNFHNAMLFPTALMQSSLHQLRIVRPLAVDKTLLEIWVFRLKGAPDSFTSRAITAANIGNSPSNIVAADDFESYWRVQAGLKGPESEWVLLSREANRDIPVGSSLQGSSGNSEVCMRNMFQAWSRYMGAQ
jgi:phenylpropionate dioxygenase-like ring-hydroxylating dioxygenase large terminal subunit